MKNILMAVFLLIGAARAQAVTDLSYHTDSRGYNTFGVITSYSMTRAWNFWGFTDIQGNQNSGSDRADLTNYFMEYRLKYNILHFSEAENILQLEAEYNGFTGPNNDLVRFGPTLTVPGFNNGWIEFRYHPYDTTEKDNSQVSVTHQFPLSNKVDIWGFYDYNILEGQKLKRPEDYGTNQIWLIYGNDEDGTTGVTMRDGTHFVWDKEQKKLVEGSPPEPSLKCYNPHPPTPK